MKILIAGVGNVLRGDDGFGVEVARRLMQGNSFSGDVEIFEAGIAGIAFVHELMNNYNALVIADAIDRGGEPGTLYLIEPDIPDPAGVEGSDLHRSLVDAHYTEPSKALSLARALKVLPSKVYIVGCQPAQTDPGLEMSEPVKNAVAVAIERIEALIVELNRSRPSPTIQS
ncbi:MAG TPA: hydrogenase maturation protease [Blastocatellia bacterium]|nr:hydrogenase maturation protease [Blastocatellia bacterium]